jgi:hypothetical protein
MKKSLLVLACAVMTATTANAAPHGVKVGILTCNVEPGWGYVLGSRKELHCRYHPNHGTDDRYTGTMSKFGLDLGYTASTTLIWNVIAPASDIRPGALKGDYAGASASAAVAVGVGANVLLGGFDKSIALQPVSIEGRSGLSAAAGIGVLTLDKDPALPPLAEGGRPAAHYAMWFDFNDDELTPSGHRAVAEAARDARTSGATHIMIVGHADSSGADGYNIDLSLRRAEAVRREMVRDGVDENLFVIDGRGDRDPAVPTPAGVREPENRRVVVTWMRDDNTRQALR